LSTTEKLGEPNFAELVKLIRNSYSSRLTDVLVMKTGA